MSTSHQIACVLASAVIGLVVPAVSMAAEPDMELRAAMQGRWKSEMIENYGSHFATRSFNFSGTQWGVVYRTYADAEGRKPLFTIRVDGYYALGGASTAVPGAIEGIFPALNRRVTAETDDGVKALAAVGCASSVGLEVSLVRASCGGIPSVMENMGEYDMVSLVGSRLHFGDRTGDLSKARPKRLTPYPLTREQ